jgi:hypothetical protein
VVNAAVTINVLKFQDGLNKEVPALVEVLGVAEELVDVCV